MFEKKIQIINECIEDSNKLGLYLTFNDKDTTRDVSLVLKKYYLWQMKMGINANVPECEMENYFLELLDEYNDSINIIVANYCLGEIYSNNSMLDKAKECFEKVIFESKKSKNTDLIHWAKKNLLDINGQCSIEPLAELNIFSFEVNYSIFNYCKDMNQYDELFIEITYLLCKNCPTYKNIAYLVCECYLEMEEWNNLIKCSIYAYEKTNDKKYVKYISIALKNGVELHDGDYKKVLQILNILLVSVEIIEWTNLLDALYCATEKSNLEGLLMHITNALKYTQLFTDELEDIPLLNNILKLIYQDIIIYRNKYEFIEKYEKDITKYLLYIGSQNKANAEVYEAYTKLKAYDDAEYDVITALKYMDEPKIEDLGNLKELKQYPYVELLIDLKYIVESFELDSKDIDNLYLKNKDTQSKIMLYGIFSSGKSSFVNSLLGKNLLEEGDLPTTSTFTFIACELEKDLEEKINYSLPIKKVILDDEFLKENNIVLIDTPGFEDADLQRGELSSNNIDICDGFIVILDATKPLTSSEFKRIKTLKEQEPNSKFIFIVNKIDFLEEDEEELEDILEYIKSNLIKVFGDEVRVYPYSSYMVKDGNREMKETICEAIKTLIPSNKADIRLKSVENTILFEKERINNKINERISILTKNINDIGDIVNKLHESEKLIQQVFQDYNNTLENDIYQLEIQSNQYIEESIKKIFNESINIVYEYSNVDTIHAQVRKRLNTKITNWFNKEYKRFVKNKADELIEKVISFIMNKDKLLRKLEDNVINECSKYYEFKENTYNKNLKFKNLKKQLNKNVSLIIDNLSMPAFFCISLESPMFKGISKFFYGESETLSNYRNDILGRYDQLSDEAVYYIINDNSRNALVNMFKYFLLEDIKIAKKELRNVGIDTKILYKNKEKIRQYEFWVKGIADDLENVRVSRQIELDEMNNIVESLQNKIDTLNVEIRKYKNQISRGVVYDNGQLYRTN